MRGRAAGRSRFAWDLTCVSLADLAELAEGTIPIARSKGQRGGARARGRGPLADRRCWTMIRSTRSATDRLTSQASVQDRTGKRRIAARASRDQPTRRPDRQPPRQPVQRSLRSNDSSPECKATPVSSRSLPSPPAGPSTSTSRLRSDSHDRRSNFLRVQETQVRHRDQTTSAYQHSGSFTARSAHRTSPESGRTAPTMTNTTRTDS